MGPDLRPRILVALQAILKSGREISSQICHHRVDPFLGALLLRGLLLRRRVLGKAGLDFFRNSPMVCPI